MKPKHNQISRIPLSDLVALDISCSHASPQTQNKSKPQGKNSVSHLHKRQASLLVNNDGDYFTLSIGRKNSLQSNQHANLFKIYNNNYKSFPKRPLTKPSNSHSASLNRSRTNTPGKIIVSSNVCFQIESAFKGPLTANPEAEELKRSKFQLVHGKNGSRRRIYKKSKDW